MLTFNGGSDPVQELAYIILGSGVVQRGSLVE